MRNERIRERAGDIRGSWSPQERTLRARNARRRQQRLIALLDHDRPTGDTNWAVGAMGADDFKRLVGSDWLPDDTSPVEPAADVMTEPLGLL